MGDIEVTGNIKYSGTLTQGWLNEKPKNWKWWYSI
jgi:hypothetical protein